MNINNRQLSILEILKDAEKAIKIKYFADKFNVSVRTIQNDINNIDYLLRENYLNVLERRENGTITLPGKNDRLIETLESLIDIEAKHIILRPEERLYALYILLMEQYGYVKTDVLVEELDVSKGTIFNDLRRLREMIKDLPFEICSSSQYGIRLQGNERAIREFAINNHMRHINISYIYNISDFYSSSIFNNFFKIWSFENTRILYKQLRLVEDMIGRKFTDRSFLFVLSSLEIAISRIRNDKIIKMDQRQLKNLFLTVEFRVASKLSKELSRKFEIEFPHDEIGYIANQLLCCNDLNMDYPENIENYPELQLTVCRLIQDVGNHLNMDFSDEISLYNDLIHQICPLIYRVKSKIILKNPLLSGIKKNYLSVFEAVNHSIGGIEQLTCTRLSEDEIGYIVIHFASIIEKKCRNKAVRPNVLIVCNSGVGTCNLLTARLTSLYEMNIVDKAASFKLEDALSVHDVDYIISTVDISHDEIDLFQVSPMINERDISRLDPYFQRNLNRVLDVDRLLDILKKNCVIQDEDILIKELSEEYSLIIKDEKKEGDDKLLKDVISKEMMEIGFNAVDWTEAVRKAGELLLNGDCVNEKYVDDIINAVKSNGAYIVIGKGIALPHSRSGKNVNKIGISFLRLKSPVCFGHPENDPVDLLLGLAAVDNRSHVMALRDLTKILSNPEKVEEIRKASTCDEIYTIFTGEGEI